MPSIGQTWVLASIGAVFEMGILSTLKRLLMESKSRGVTLLYAAFNMLDAGSKYTCGKLALQMSYCDVKCGPTSTKPVPGGTFIQQEKVKLFRKPTHFLSKNPKWQL
jgi:hypothetical protein